MDWIKVLNRHIIFEYTDLSDAEFRAWIKIMSLTAFLEAMPTREQMLNYTHHATLKSLEEKLMKHSCTLHGVLMKVLCDVSEVKIKRATWKNNKQQFRAGKANVSMDVSKTSKWTSPHREEKRREDNKANTILSPQCPKTEPVDNFSDQGLNPADFNPPQKAALKENPKDKKPKTGTLELQALIAQVKTKYPRMPIDTWYGKNMHSHPLAIIHVLKSLLKHGDNLVSDDPPLLLAYIQSALNVEVGKYNARDSEAEHEQCKRPTGREFELLKKIMEGREHG